MTTEKEQAQKPHLSAITRPFADGDYTFALSWKWLEELERIFDGSVFPVLRRMISEQAATSTEVSEIIRLGLIGGGTEPSSALALVKTYVEDRPLMENLDLAVSILEAAIFGSPEWQASEEGIASAATAAKRAAAMAEILGSVRAAGNG